MATLPGYKATAVDGSGNTLGATSVEVRRASDNALATLVDASTGGSPLTNPFNADAGGDFEFFTYAGDYIVTLGVGTSPQTFPLSLRSLGDVSRADFVAAVAAGFTLVDGATHVAGPVAYQAKAGATDIPDLLGWVPFGQYHIEHFGGGVSSTPAENANAFEEAQLSLGVGTIELLAGDYTFGASPNTATYENGGNYLPASNACMVVRPSISVLGQPGGKTKVIAETQTLAPFYVLSPDKGCIRDIETDGQWDGVTATPASGILNVVPSDADLPKLIDDDFTSGGVDGWGSQGTDFSISNVSNDLRLSHGATYTGAGYAVKTITTEIGKEYRIRIGLDPDETLPDPEYISVAASTGGIGGRFFEQAIGETISNSSAATVTFTATSTSTQIHILSAQPTQTDLQSTYFTIREVTLAEFSTADQMLWVRDFDVTNVCVRNQSSYGILFQDGDMTNVTIQNCRVVNTGGDGIDWKQRGPSADNYGLVLNGILVEDPCMRVPGTAGVDLRGDITVSNVQVRGYELSGQSTYGIRFRTQTADVDPDSGDSARGASLTNFFVYGQGGIGTGSGVQTGSNAVNISNGFVEDANLGVQAVGNSFGNAARSKVSNVTAENCTTGISSNSTNVTWMGIDTKDCTTGFENTADNVEFHGCKDDGSLTTFTDSGTGVQVFGGNLYDGVWTPVYAQGGNEAVSYNTQVGSYRRIGDQVTVNFVVNPSDIGAASGAVEVTGLPFTAANITDLNYSMTVGHLQGMALGAVGRSVLGRVDSNDNKVKMYLEDALSGTSSLQTTEWPVGGQVMLSGTYTAA